MRKKRKTPTTPIFSGERSAQMWDEINRAKTVDDLKNAIYVVCCKLQELESKLDAKAKAKTGPRR